MTTSLSTLRVYVPRQLAEQATQAASKRSNSLSSYVRSLIEADINGIARQASRDSSTLEYLQLHAALTLKEQNPALLEELKKAHRARMAGLSDAR